MGRCGDGDRGVPGSLGSAVVGGVAPRMEKSWFLLS